MEHSSSETSGPASASPSFKDRRVGLALFGTLQLFIALGLLALALLQVTFGWGASSMSPDEMGPPSIYLIGATLYTALAGGAIWLGIGSILCRRWARALTLALAWIALGAGGLGVLYLVAIFGLMTATMGQELADQLPIALLPIACGTLIVLLIYVALPGAFVLFYRSHHVGATCELHDPKPRWTDPLPTPVLAGGLIIFSSVAIVTTPLLGFALPFFGAVLTGPRAWLYALLVAGLAVVLVRGVFRRQRWAWLGALAFIALNGLSAWLTFVGDGLLLLYENMQVPTAQLEEMGSAGILSLAPWTALAATAAMLAFWLWLGRYFRTTEAG